MKKIVSNIEINNELYYLQDEELTGVVESKLDKKFVDNLPDVSEASENTIYITTSKIYTGDDKYVIECVPYVLKDGKFNAIGSSGNTDKFYSKSELKVSDEVNESTGTFKYVVPDSKAVINYVEDKIAIDESELILKYENEKFGTVLSLYHNTTDKLIEVRGIDNAVVSSISTESIVGSGIVENAYLKEEEEGTFIVLKFQNVEETIDIDVTKLIDIYNGSNIELSEKYSVPSSYTAPLSGMNMDSAIGNLVKKAQLIESRISDIEGKTGSIPKGIICMWSGSIEDIPGGWHLCDGTEGTPDMSNRFIVGIGSKYAIGDTGGKDNITEVIYHSHSGTATTVTNKSSQSVSISSSGIHDHKDITINTSGTHMHTVQFQGWNNCTGSGRQVISRNRNTNDSVETTHLKTNDGEGGHTHKFSISQSGSHTHTFNLTSPSHNHELSINTAGSVGSIDNRPMYYALAFIMKIEEGSDSGESGTSSNDTCIKCADLDEKDYPVGTFAMHSGATGTYRRGFIYERTDNGWVSTLVMNVIQ